MGAAEMQTDGKGAAENAVVAATPRRPAWNEGAMWMGAGMPALLRLWRRYRFRIDRRYAFDAAIDLFCSGFNSTLGMAERALIRLKRRKLDSPIFILGHWRTGTTLLHELLSLDGRHRAPTTYECFMPHHFRLTERVLAPWTGFVLPPTRGVDNMALGWNRPQEDEFALMNLGVQSPYSCIAFPNEPRRDERFLDLEELSPTERERWESTFRSFLQRLVAFRPGRLVIKSPTHTCRVPTLRRMFPDAKFIYVVRDPRAVIPSTVRLWNSLATTYGYQQPRDTSPYEEVLNTFAHFHERFEATKSEIPAEDLVTVRYEELVGDPLGVLSNVYDRLPLGRFAEAREAMENHVGSQRDYRPNRHQVDEALVARIQEATRSYQELHGY